MRIDANGFACPIEAGIHFLKAMLVAGPSVVVSLLPDMLRRPVEKAMRESLESGFSTIIVVATVFAVASAALA